jgi:hypothetical protein
MQINNFLFINRVCKERENSENINVWAPYKWRVSY